MNNPVEQSHRKQKQRDYSTMGFSNIETAPTIGLLELADSSVNFAVRPWVRAEDYWNIFFEFQENIKKRLDTEGISIPFPQRDIHVFQRN